MYQFESKSADDLWSAAAALFRAKAGQTAEALPAPQPSRAGPTHEVLHVGFLLRDPRQRWVFARQPAINPAFALAEALWICAGRNDSAFLKAWNSHLADYCGDGATFHGAYGYRIRHSFDVDQLQAAFETLRADPDSRQAVLSIWDPREDLPVVEGMPRNRDIPCNIASFIRVRDGRLEWTQVLRSNDLFLGFPHNIVQFTFLQEILAGWLNLDLGGYFHLSDSLHVYQRDAAQIERDGPGVFASNDDDLRLPKDESDRVLGIVVDIASHLATGTLSSGDAQKLVSQDQSLPVAYTNILRVLGAEAARRADWLDEATDIMAGCSNTALTLLWKRWWNRVRPSGKSTPKTGLSRHGDGKRLAGTS